MPLNFCAKKFGEPFIKLLFDSQLKIILLNCLLILDHYESAVRVLLLR